MKKISDDLWFLKAKKNIYSQHGEDGIIREIFDLIATKDKFVVECGAFDGRHDSNARSLIEEGWSALLIEADPTVFVRLQENYASVANTKCANRFISFSGHDSVDEIFSSFGLPTDFDLFVLDIDGNEYHVLDSMQKYSPRVLVVEFNQTIPNEVSFIQPRDMSVQQGSSLLAITNLCKKKGYRLVAVTDINAFYVKDTESSVFMDLQNDLETLRSNNIYETKLYQLYDGTIKLSGNTELLWHHIPISEEKVQVLPKSRRYYPNGINSSLVIRKIKFFVRKSGLYPLVKFIRKIPLTKWLVN